MALAEIAGAKRCACTDFAKPAKIPCSTSKPDRRACLCLRAIGYPASAPWGAANRRGLDFGFLKRGGIELGIGLGLVDEELPGLSGAVSDPGNGLVRME
jgi:hypothetical protein